MHTHLQTSFYVFFAILLFLNLSAPKCVREMITFLELAAKKHGIRFRKNAVHARKRSRGTEVIHEKPRNSSGYDYAILFPKPYKADSGGSHTSTVWLCKW